MRFCSYVSRVSLSCLTAICSILLGSDAWGQKTGISVVPVITTIAGNGSAGYGGDGGLATGGLLNGPSATAVDKKGNVYIADTYNSRIRKIDTNGIISTIAGNGNCLYGGDGGPAESATVCQPYGIAVDQAGKIYIADTGNNRIREIETNGRISTIAGNGNADFSGDGGSATSAGINAPTGVALDSTNHIYIADRGNYRVRKIDPNGTISTVAGNGTSGFSGDDGQAIDASFNTVWSVAVDGAGNIFVADIYNTRIRKINSNGIISTIAGGSYGFSGDGGPAINAQLSNSYGVAADSSGNVYFADTYNHRIRVITTAGTIATIAGDGTGAFGGDGGPATQAQLNNPYGVTVDADGNVYIADLNNQRIRKLGPSDVGPTPPQPQPIPSFGAIPVGESSLPINVSIRVNEALTITSVSAPPSEGGAQEYTLGAISGCSIGAATAAGTTCTVPITFSPGYPGLRGVPLVAVTTVGTFRFALRGVGLGPQVTISPGVIQTVAGNGSSTFGGDNGAATSAGMLTPSGVARDNAGNMYIATYDKRIRRVAPNGTITTFAGTGAACPDSTSACGDGGPATSATFIQPDNIAVDPAGNLYISDTIALKVRKVDANGTITTIAGNGSVCAPTTPCGDGGPATNASFAAPYGIAIDANGNLYIADQTGYRVRKVNPSGTISTVAGTGTQGFSGDGGLATNANLNYPLGVAVDIDSNVYFSDAGNQRIRKVDGQSGVITTLAGGGSSGTIPVAGAPATSVELSLPTGISIDPGGSLYIADFGFHAVDKVDIATGTIRSLAGVLGSAGFSGDGGPATVAKLDQPVALTLDSFGQVYVADFTNNRVRQISATAAPVSFPDTATGQTSSSQTVYVSNIGNRNLSFLDISATGDFIVDPSGDCVNVTSLAGGTTCAAPTLFDPQQPGPRMGSAKFADNALNVVGASQPVALSGNGLQVATITALSLSTSNTILPGTPVTLTASVAPNTAGSVTISGTISFYDGATLLQAATTITSQGRASITVSTFTTGVHSLTAVYSGDANFSTSTSPAISLTVDAAATVTLSSSQNPIHYGDAVTFTATVPTGYTGTIQFKLGQDNVGNPVPLVGTTASIPTSSLGIGPHVITAVYSGDSVRAGATSDSQVELVERVVLTVKANDSSRSYGQPNGSLGYTITGFVGSDNEASAVTGSPLLVTDAIPAAPVGTYPIVARQGSLSSTPYTFQFANGTLTVMKATPSATDIVLTTTANPAVWGQTIKLTAQLPTHATGQVVFMDGTTVLGTATLADSVAVISTAQLAVGGHQITAVYAGDSNYGGTTSFPLNQQVFKATLNVVASDAQRIYGQPNPPTNYSFSGFVNGDTTAMAVTGTPNLTTAAVPAAPVGGYPILATAGTLASSNYTFNFIAGTLSISPATPGGGPTSAIVLASSLNPSQFGNAVVFTASLPARATGTVNFVDGSTLLGVGAVVSDAASITTSTLAIGTHPVTAIYSGDKNYLAASSTVLSQIVNKAVTAVAVASSLNPAFVGNTITFTATVPAGATGAVTFIDGMTSLGIVTIAPGTAPALSTNRLLVGTHTITAAYSGDANFSASASAALLQTVNRLTPPITETSLLNPAPSGAAITLTATVPVAATGTISFYEGTTLLGTGPVSNGTASIATTSLAPGTHLITAVYSGDASYTMATATGLSEVVLSSADFTVSSSSGRQLIPPGASATFAIVVGSMNGSFTNPVTMSATSLPPGASYTFSPAAVTPGASGSNTNFVVSVPKQSAAARSNPSGSTVLALLLIPLTFTRRYRRRPYRFLVWSVIALSSFHVLTGCGAGGYFSQPEQTYSITVTGTSGSIVHSTTVSLTVE